MKSVSPHLSKTYKATALSLAISSADILFILLIINSFYILHFCRKNTLFPRNHQENQKKSASYQPITTKSTVNFNCKLLFLGGPIPQNLAQTFDWSANLIAQRFRAPEGGYLPNPYGRDLGLGYRVRTLPLGRDRWGYSFTITSNVLKISLMSYQKLAFFTYSR